MRNRIAAFMVVVSAVILLGMGGGGGIEHAPRVEKNYSVVVTDIAGKKIEGQKFSVEGRIYLSGSMGMAQVSMPFDRISELSIGDKKERKVLVSVKLRDGKEATLELDAKSRCIGEATFGAFMLPLDDVKSIAFKHNAQ